MATNLLALGNYVQQQGDLGRARGMDNRFQALSGQALAGDDAAMDQMVAMDPGRAAQVRQAGDAKALQLRGAAKYMQSALESADPAKIAGAWQSVRPYLAKFGKQPPEQWDDAMRPAMEQVLAKTAYLEMAGTGNGNVQSTYVDGDGNRVAIMRDGSQRVLGPNDAGMANQAITVEGPNGEPIQMVFNKRTGRYQPMGAGAAPQPPTRVDMEADIALANDMIAAGIPEAQIEAFLQSRGQRADGAGGQGVQPGQIGVGMTAADKAAAQEAAKQDVQTRFLPQQEQIKTDAAINRARGEAQAKSEVEVGAATAKKERDAGNTLEVLDEAETLLKSASGGLLQAGRDRIVGAAGYATEGAQATTSLKILAAKLIANVPRFEGPQSNIDVQFYREAAGDLANDMLPVGSRLAALQTLRSLNMKYAGSTGDARPTNDVQPTQRARNPQTGEVLILVNGQWVPE